MKINYFLDKFVSNLIVFFSYSLVACFWYYLYSNYINEVALLLYFPYGITILAFLFFGNKIIYGLVLSKIIIYLILQNYNLELPFNNYIILSLGQLISMPITLLALQKFNIKVGAGKNYRLDKTNIYYVLLITFFSTLVLGILFIFSFFFFYHETNIANFILGNFFGALALIILMKISVNLPNIMSSLIKGN